MKEIDDNSIDLTVTSPPYDNLRDYKGYVFDFENIAKELYRVTKNGGIVVWVVGDQTINFCESLTSFKQAIYFKEVCGFNLLDTMIYGKENYLPPPPLSKSYAQQFEYMFIISKGKPNIFKTIKIPCIHAGKIITRTKRGTNERDGGCSKTTLTKDEKTKGNIWFYKTGGGGKTKSIHPATFPEDLAKDHIISWSNEKDIILDPMCGSGTTCKMAKLLNRNFIGIEISQEYCDIANKRLDF